MNRFIQNITVRFCSFINNQEAQDLVEYALLITLVALAAVAGMNKVASAINSVFSKISTTLS
jgi:pilus assembly protein Flp/PilA